MTYIDYGREQDLEQLYLDYQQARGQRREEIERLMSEIIRQSKGTYELRRDLIEATRAGDKNRVNYCREELRRIRAQETSGMRIQV